MRLMYVKAPACESDLPSIRQLAPLTTDGHVTPIETPGAAISVLRGTPLEKRADGFVTSPALDESALAGLGRDLVNDSPPVALIAVVLDLDHSLRAINAGADAVLLLVNGSLANAEEVLGRVERLFCRPADAQPLSPIATPSDKNRRVLVDFSRFRKDVSENRRREPVTVDVVRHVDGDLVEAAARLVPQISAAASVPGFRELEQVVKAPGTTLIVAREGHTVVGMLTLHTLPAVTGVHARILDLVVDTHAKGRGVSESLTREAVRLAVEQGACTAELTSRPSHLGNGRLYERIGFERRETHLYRYRLSG